MSAPLPISIADVEAAQARLDGVAVRTPLLRYPRTAPRLGNTVWIKPESLQLTGSFKLRGAYNKMAALPTSTYLRRRTRTRRRCPTILARWADRHLARRSGQPHAGRRRADAGGRHTDLHRDSGAGG